MAAAIALILGVSACDHYAAAAGTPTPEAPRVTPQLTPAPEPDPSTVGCGEIRTSDPLVIVDAAYGPGGRCVPPSRIVMARCDPAVDPIALLNLGSVPRRFLGGAFAVPVAALPVGSHEIGVTGAGRIWVGPTAPRALYIESGGMLERWLTLPPAARLDEPPSVTMIGDSILDGAAAAMTEALPSWDLLIDAEVGRSSSGAATVAESLPPPLADVVVVEVGVNDHDPVAFAANRDRILAATQDADLVVWVTAHGPDTAVPAINRAIADGLATLPDGALADWDRWAPPESLSSDGVHPLAEATGLLAELVAPTIDSWRSATSGGGAAACVPAVTAAVVG